MNKPAPVVATKKAPTRDDIRAALIGSRPKGETKLVTLYGMELELHQPTLEAILKARDQPDDKARTVAMIVEYTYVPGTNDRVFEDSDAPHILQWPFGPDMTKFQEAIADLTGVDIKQAMKELEEDPLGG